MFGSLPYGNNGQGYFVAAMPDGDPNYSGACGRCYEVACENKAFKDGYGNEIDRSQDHVCIDETKSIIVKM